MNQKRTFMLLALVVAVLILGIAYAAIQNVTLSVAGNVTASPDQGNFKVGFTGNYTFTEYPVETRATGDKIGFGIAGAGTNKEGTHTGTFYPEDGQYVYFEVDNLSVKGDKAIMKLEVKNSSADLSALLAVSGGLGYGNGGAEPNPDYFKVTPSVERNTLASGEKTWVTVTVELIKTPIEDEVKTGVNVNLIATPTQS